VAEEPAIAEEPQAVAEEPAIAEEPAPIAAMTMEPQQAERSETREAVTAADTRASETETAAVAVLQAAVVDVMVAEPEEAPEAESVPGATDRIEPAAARSIGKQPGKGSKRPARPPIAVGPGPTAPPPKAAISPATIPTAAADHPTQPTPIAQPTPPAGPAPAKPAPKRPSRSISIFTRSWSGGSGKAVGSRRRDRS
jgi:hypothetical protein